MTLVSYGLVLILYFLASGLFALLLLAATNFKNFPTWYAVSTLGTHIGPLTVYISIFASVLVLGIALIPKIFDWCYPLKRRAQKTALLFVRLAAGGSLLYRFALFVVGFGLEWWSCVWHTNCGGVFFDPLFTTGPNRLFYILFGLVGLGILEGVLISKSRIDPTAFRVRLPPAKSSPPTRMRGTVIRSQRLARDPEKLEVKISLLGPPKKKTHAQ